MCLVFSMNGAKHRSIDVTATRLCSLWWSLFCPPGAAPTGLKCLPPGEDATTSDRDKVSGLDCKK